MAPQSPENLKREVIWYYSQGGFGIYYGDLCFYSVDFLNHVQQKGLGKAKCPLYILAGEYDYSGTIDLARKASENYGGGRLNNNAEIRLLHTY